MNDENSSQEGQCQCGATTFTVQGEPLARLYCHCTICQEFNNAAYSDVSIYLSRDVQLHDKETVCFKKYKSPPAVERGKCATCDKPAIELIDLPLFPAMTIIPSANIPAGPLLPEPSVHIFYHRRVEDIKDDLPKHSGFIKSQLAMTAELLPNLVRRLTKG